MKILHSADWHIGHQLYGCNRIEEFGDACRQVVDIVRDERPDAVVIAGDIYDTTTPSAEAEKLFVQTLLQISDAVPDITIVAIAGNHDSAGRQDAHSALWERAGIHVIGGIVSRENYDDADVKGQVDSPADKDIHAEADEILAEKYVFEVPERGYIIAIPYANRFVAVDKLCARLTAIVDRLNHRNLPVVMVTHATVDEIVSDNYADTAAGYGGSISTIQRGDDEHPVIGTVEGRSLSMWGSGYDYLALGHIHGRYVRRDESSQSTAAYSGSLLPVNFDQANSAHGVYIVDIPGHKTGTISLNFKEITPLRVLQTIPRRGTYTCDEALDALSRYHCDRESYVRLKIKQKDPLPQGFAVQARKVVDDHNRRCIISTVEYEAERDAVDAVAAATRLTFSDFDTMTPTDMAELYARAKGLSVWDDDCKERLLEAVSEIEEEKRTR